MNKSRSDIGELEKRRSVNMKSQFYSCIMSEQYVSSSLAEIEAKFSSTRYEIVFHLDYRALSAPLQHATALHLWGRCCIW